MFKRYCIALLVFVVFYSTGLAAQRDMPYAGEEKREIKALSGDDIKGYLTGKGMGLAKSAELNHYPGPKHVLNLAEELGLSDEQLAQTKAIRMNVLEETQRLGALIVEKERTLDTLFASGQIDELLLRVHVAEISELQGLLRISHLNAHMKTKAVLTPEQIGQYDNLRGYLGSDESH